VRGGAAPWAVAALVVGFVYHGGLDAWDAAALVPVPAAAASAIEEPDLPSFQSGWCPPAASWADPGGPGPPHRTPGGPRVWGPVLVGGLTTCCRCGYIVSSRRP
jgi:hypothetical protein